VGVGQRRHHGDQDPQRLLRQEGLGAAGMEGVCVPSTWTKTDHRPTTEVQLYRARVTGATMPRSTT
jgi:hypothetical protein